MVAEDRPEARNRLTMALSSAVSLLLAFAAILLPDPTSCMSTAERHRLRDQAKEMFDHGFDGYMRNAFPADELMPLSCRGRYRDVEANRGDLDDALGNFSLTLIDSLDTLVIINELEKFDSAVRLVADSVTFDSDIVVSVFEVNIRVMGGLLSGHVLANYVQERFPPLLHWYQGQLLVLAQDLGNRLMPAFNTTTGIPHPRVNLRHGMNSPKIISVRETCSACAGTMILEFGALSRLTGDHVYERVARKAMDYLWSQRNRGSDLIGTILNIHSGDWVRRDSGVGAGVDSYYEYLLKAYILFGDDQYLKRFNRHYSGIMKYVSQGPLLVDVHMHRPTSNAKGFMDSLLAFWPGLQVLKGDLVPAIETHELLYQVIQRHNYLMPEAFSISDFDVHWAMSLMRPEFVESTYFLYKSTGDPHYLDVGKNVLTAINKFSRSKCGFAAVKDVRTGSQEDRMDSFVLAETFKYLFLLFADPSDLVLNLEDFIFTTEAHLLPLSLSVVAVPTNSTRASNVILPADPDGPLKELSTCPSNRYLTQQSYSHFRSPHDVRASLKGFVESSRRSMFGSGSASSCPSHIRHLKSKKLKLKVTAAEFSASNPQHLEAIRRMGIQAILLADGKIQLIQSTATASTEEDAEEGIMFMQEMIALSKEQLQKSQEDLRSVQFTSPKTGVKILLPAGTALFGVDLNDWGHGIYAPAVKIDPFHGCEVRPDHNHIRDVKGRIAIVRRGDCMFVQKARNCEKLGAAGLIVIDNDQESTASASNMFSMSGDGNNDVSIPVLFLYGVEGTTLLDVVLKHPDLVIHMLPAPSSQTQSHTSSDGKQRFIRSTKAQSERRNGDPESKHSQEDRRSALKQEIEKMSRLSDLLNNMEMIGKIIEIKEMAADSATQSLLANLVHQTTGTIEEVVESPAAHEKWVQFLKAIGFDHSLINSTINPAQDKAAFIAFVSRGKKRRREV